MILAAKSPVPPPLCMSNLTMVLLSRGVWKTENRFRFDLEFIEPSKNVTSVQKVFRQKLLAILNSN